MDGPVDPRPFIICRLGALAADVLARAIARGVYHAVTPEGMDTPAWSSL